MNVEIEIMLHRALGLAYYVLRRRTGYKSFPLSPKHPIKLRRLDKDA